jgi:large subunit ribosomal protein L22
MNYIAIQKNTRQTPRKVRLVANQIKDLPLEQALRQLAVIQKKSTLVLMKTLKQAMANAKNNHGVSPAELQIKEIMIGDGTRYKRFRAVSRGRAHNVVKRACNVRVVLEKKTETSLDEKSKAAPAAKPVVEKAPAKAEAVKAKPAAKTTTTKKSTKPATTTKKK